MKFSLFIVVLALCSKQCMSNPLGLARIYKEALNDNTTSKPTTTPPSNETSTSTTEATTTTEVTTTTDAKNATDMSVSKDTPLVRTKRSCGGGDCDCGPRCSSCCQNSCSQTYTVRRSCCTTTRCCSPACGCSPCPSPCCPPPCCSSPCCGGGSPCGFSAFRSSPCGCGSSCGGCGSSCGGCGSSCGCRPSCCAPRCGCGCCPPPPVAVAAPIHLHLHNQVNCAPCAPRCRSCGCGCCGGRPNFGGEFGGYNGDFEDYAPYRRRRSLQFLQKQLAVKNA